MRKIALADGDGAGKVRDDRYSVRRRHQPIAEKERRSPAYDDGKHVGRKRAGELARHQHLGVGEFPHLVPGRRHHVSLGVGLRLEAVEKAALALIDPAHLLEGERPWPVLGVAEKSTPRPLERRLEARAAPGASGP